MKILNTFAATIYILFLATLANAKKGDALFRGCSAWVGKFTFTCSEEFVTAKGKRVSSCNCWSPEFLTTYVDCIKRAKNGYAKRAIASMVTACTSEDIRPGFSGSQLLEIAQNETVNFVEANIFKDNLLSIQKQKIPMLQPIKFTQAQIDQAYKSFAIGFSNKDMAEIYGYDFQIFIYFIS